MNDDNIIVKNSSPYPKITVCEPNLDYARILSLDLASSKSEFSTITTYVYQNWVLNSEYHNIANTIIRIAMVEMHHLNILGQLITLLGGDPRYQAVYQRGYAIWNGNMTDYNKNIRRILLNNIAKEQNTIDGYISQIEFIKDENICNILNRIVLDEKVHLNVFCNFLSQID